MIGKPCVKCGSTKRNTEGRCVPCRNARARKAYAVTHPPLPAKDTNAPCEKCGSVEKYADGRCAPCKREKANARYRANPEKYVAWRAANPEKVIESCRKWRTANLETQRERERNRWRTPEGKVERRAAASKRRAVELAQRCACCTDEQLEMAYWLCGDGVEVDHKIALALGGLHCVHNLQVLTVEQHKIKTRADAAAIARARRSERETQSILV